MRMVTKVKSKIKEMYFLNHHSGIKNERHFKMSLMTYQIKPINNERDFNFILQRHLPYPRQHSRYYRCFYLKLPPLQILHWQYLQARLFHEVDSF